ncbi:MAG: hypothetical protein DYH03_05735 [Nitrospira sp. NTP1]|nr:hypothetical protein [Nitrospira sp. NTP1]
MRVYPFCAMGAGWHAGCRERPLLAERTAFPHSLRRLLFECVRREAPYAVVVVGSQHFLQVHPAANEAVAERIRTVSRAWAL